MASRAASLFISSIPTCTSGWAKRRQTSRLRCRLRNPIWHTRSLKDPYIFKPAPLDESTNERALEYALLNRLRDFLIELGAGFAFVGNQYRIEVNGDEFFLDLLFYHTRLHCYVVVDLKVVDFQPEFAGKMSFYQAAVDNLVKTPQDSPTIGIILCKGKNKTVVE
jgi:predicted nuclease of restriction endonuclease-like (RecB) superfamily